MILVSLCQKKVYLIFHYSLYNLAIDLGVKFHFNSEIDKILIKHKSAVGVSINKINYKADIIVSNMDINLTYDRLLKGYKKPFFIKNYQPSSSAVVFYWNMNKSFSNISVHNIIFSRRPERKSLIISSIEIQFIMIQLFIYVQHQKL